MAKEAKRVKKTRPADPIGDLINQAKQPRGFTGEDLRKAYGKKFKESPLYFAELPKVSKKARKAAQARQKAAPDQEFGRYNRGQRQSKNVEDATFFSHRFKDNLGS